MKLEVSFLCLLLLSADSYHREEEKPPTYLTVAVGDYVLLDCDLDFPQDIPIPYQLNWNKEGQTVFSWYNSVVTAVEPYVGRINLLNPHIPSFGDGAVNLTSIRESDTGWFECQVLFPNRFPPSRNNGTWYHITVNGGNVLKIPPINQTTLEGEKAHFSCETKTSDTVVTWYKDGAPLLQYPDTLQRSFISEEGSLTIQSTVMGDLGEYRCEAINAIGERQDATAFLNVQYKAKVVYAPEKIFFAYGRSAVLDCHFRANPPLTNLRWEKNGFLYDPYNIDGVVFKRNGSLAFTKVDESHNGYYTCIPYNDLGTNGPSPSMQVIVQKAPTFEIAPQHIYLRKLGETVNMPCIVENGNGYAPIVVWYRKDGASLPVGRYSIRGGNLTITKIEEEDRGIYQCSASNEVATISVETELLIENVLPRAPYNLTATATEDSVHLRWVPGRNRHELEYDIWYSATDVHEWHKMKVGSKKIEATIGNLKQGREYEFIVSSHSRHSDGLFSKPLIIRTLGGTEELQDLINEAEIYTPISYPRNVRIHPTELGYLVTWDPPEFGVESLKCYMIKWHEDDNSQYLSGSDETRDTSYLVRYLEEDMKYHFQVTAMTYDDFQSASERISITIPAYKKIRIISLGIAGVLIFIVVGFLLVYFIKRRCSRALPDLDEIKNPEK